MPQSTGRMATPAWFNCARSGDLARLVQLNSAASGDHINTQYSVRAVVAVGRMCLSCEVTCGPSAHQCQSGDTMLHLAASQGHTDVCAWLIGQGASLEVKNKDVCRAVLGPPSAFVVVEFTMLAWHAELHGFAPSSLEWPNSCHRSPHFQGGERERHETQP